MRAAVVTLALLAAPLAAQSPAPPPAPAMVPFTPERILLDPGPSLRHHLTPPNVAIPPEGVRFAVRCSVLVRDGRVAGCQTPPGSPALAEIARRRASFYLFRIDATVAAMNDTLRGAIGFTAGAPVDIVETVRPGDRRAVDFMEGERVGSRMLRFTAGPDAAMMEGLYPIPAVRVGATARVIVTCRVQPDLRAFCVEFRTSTPWLEMPEPVREDFVNGTLALVSQLRVEPLLTDGRSAVGKVFQQAVRFAMPE